MDTEEFNELFRQRTKKLALLIIQLTADLKYSEGMAIIRKQLIRATTSVAANFRAYTRGRSGKEKFSKLCIVVEEADETQFWSEMLIDANYISEKVFKPILDENEEILKVMSKFRKNFRF